MGTDMDMDQLKIFWDKCSNDVLTGQFSVGPISADTITTGSIATVTTGTTSNNVITNTYTTTGTDWYSTTIASAPYEPEDAKMNIKTIDLNQDTTFTFTVELKERNWNCAPADKEKYYNPYVTPSIVNINIIVPDKVVEVTIYDGIEYVYKQVCKEPDVFDLKFALALAWTKYKYSKFQSIRLTREGIEYYAHQYIAFYVETNKEFDRAIKAYNRTLKEKEKAEAEEAERKAIIERRREKNKKRREKMAARKKENEINTITEAIRRSRDGK